MTITKHDEIRVPALSLLSERGQLKLSEFEAPLAKHFALSEDELHEEYESGNGKIFEVRCLAEIAGTGQQKVSHIDVDPRGTNSGFGHVW